MNIHHFITHKNNTTSINITPYHYKYLMHLTNTRFGGNLSLAINYLLKKYLVYLYHISIAQTKKTLTASYQPRTKGYIIRKIHVQPTYWGKLCNLRSYLGYSVSFILRIMLDWEMQENEIPLNPLIALPTLDNETETQNIQLGNNYSSFCRMDHKNLEVYGWFSCPAA